jgi:predicted N-acyltransferase
MSNSSQHLRIVQDIEQLPELQWRSLVVGHPALRLEVLKGMVATSKGTLALRIFLLEDESGLAGAAVCEATIASDVPSKLESLLLGRAARRLHRLGVSTRPALLFQTPLGAESAVVLRQAATTEQSQVLCRLLDGIEEHAARFKFGIAFINVFADDELLRHALGERGYLDTEIQPTARMEIEWTDVDGYIKHLQRRSRTVAHTVRTERNRNRSNGVTFKQVPGSVADANALYVIARDHFRQRNGQDPPYNPELLPLLAQTLGEDLLIFEAVRDGRRVGMLGAVRSGSVGWIAWIGIEARDRPNDFTYPNLGFYHAADWAPLFGIKTLLYGINAIEAKRRRGCRIITSHLFYRPRRLYIRFLAKPYFWIHRAWYRRKLR